MTMNPSSRDAFPALIVARAVHSTEEYFTPLYGVLAPARFVTGFLFEGPTGVGLPIGDLGL